MNSNTDNIINTGNKKNIPILSQNKISIGALILLITGSIDSIRNLPSTALFGSSLIFFFIISACVFLIPVGLISAELASTWPEEEGGIYSWVHHALNKPIAFLTIWLQWVNTLVWFPSILIFIAATAAYLINPHWSQNPIYLISVVLIVFWSLTFVGLKGLKSSARFAGFCAITGMILPMAILIALACIWFFQGKALMIDLSFHQLIPNLTESQSWVSITAMMTSFLGMELAAVHVKNIQNPQRNFPKAIFCSALLILTTMILGSLAIALVIPSEKINLARGVMQAFSAYHLDMLMPLWVILLLLGSLGSMVNWIISPAKGLLAAADHGFFPNWFYKKNQHGIASRILLLQACVITLLCCCFLLFPTVNGVYWFFTDLSTELYILMYVFLFIAAIPIKKRFGHLNQGFRLSNCVYYSVCILGLIGCTATLIIGFIPPEKAIKISASHYQWIFAGGILAMLTPAFILLLKRHICHSK